MTGRGWGDGRMGSGGGTLQKVHHIILSNISLDILISIFLFSYNLLNIILNILISKKVIFRYRKTSLVIF